MAAYNFQRQFVPLILAGRKCSTIRKRRANGYLPRVGDLLRLYNGMRTKGCKLIAEVAVTEVRPISITARNGCAEVILNMNRLTDAQTFALAISDGFKSVREFAEFFESKYGGELQGYLIEWRKA